MNDLHGLFPLLSLQPAEGYVKFSTPENNTVHVDLGENLVLKVEFDAYPAPNQQYWIHTEETLLNTSDHYMKSTESGNRYIIPKLN